MPDDGQELPYHEEARGQDSAEVEGYPDAMDTVAGPIPFTGRYAVGIAAAG